MLLYMQGKSKLLNSKIKKTAQERPLKPPLFSALSFNSLVMVYCKVI